MIKKISFLLILMFPLFGHSAPNAQVLKYFAVRPGMFSFKAVGASYMTKEFSLLGAEGHFGYQMSQNWNLRLGGGLTLGGEILSLTASMAYHFNPLRWESMAISDMSTVTRHPLWSPYVGVGLAMNRVQLAMTRSDGSQQDLVLAALIGPRMYGGTFYSLTPRWYVNGEVAFQYGLGPEVAGSGNFLTIGAAFILP